MWVEFVTFLPSFNNFSSGSPVFLPPKKPTKVPIWFVISLEVHFRVLIWFVVVLVDDIYWKISLAFLCRLFPLHSRSQARQTIKWSAFFLFALIASPSMALLKGQTHQLPVCPTNSLSFHLSIKVIWLDLTSISYLCFLPWETILNAISCSVKFLWDCPKSSVFRFLLGGWVAGGRRMRGAGWRDKNWIVQYLK